MMMTSVTSRAAGEDPLFVDNQADAACAPLRLQLGEVAASLSAQRLATLVHFATAIRDDGETARAFHAFLQLRPAVRAAAIQGFEAHLVEFGAPPTDPDVKVVVLRVHDDCGPH